MQRDMSYELDGIFSSRNAGELVSVKQTRTTVKRSPGLAPVGKFSSKGYYSITPSSGSNLTPPMALHNLTRPLGRNIDGNAGKNLTPRFYKNPSDLAEDFDDQMEGLTLPLIGEVTITKAAIAAGIGFLVYKLLNK